MVLLAGDAEEENRMIGINVKYVLTILGTTVLCIMGIIFPHPILTNIIIDTLRVWTFQIFAATNPHSLPPNLIPYKLALTTTILVGIFLSFGLNKMAVLCKRFNVNIYSRIANICAMYCIVGTLIVIGLLWFSLHIEADENHFWITLGFIVKFGGCVF